MPAISSIIAHHIRKQREIMNKPPIIKQGSHLSTDMGSLDSGEERETQTRTEVLKAADRRITQKTTEPEVTKSND
jgi:hypothetical protein